MFTYRVTAYLRADDSVTTENMTSFEDCVVFASKALGLDFSLKDKQLETLRTLYNGHDCVSYANWIWQKCDFPVSSMAVSVQTRSTIPINYPCCESFDVINARPSDDSM